MIKKIAVLFVVLLFTGCSLFNKAAKENPPTDHHVVCSNIKQKIIFSQGNEGFKNADWDSPTQQAQLLKEYRKYDCDNQP